MERDSTYYKYHRQILLKEFGEKAQDKLLNAKVLVVGAGGLGCPALQYLAAAGVGTIGIIDFDIVDITNLHRQVLYSIEDIGKPKAFTAAEKLKQLNTDIKVISIQDQLQNSNALELVNQFDIIIDGSDNFTTRYLVNDACVLLDKPLVYGSILRFEGQVAVFNLQCVGFDYKTNYRDLFPEPPSPGSVPSCSEAGVLGVLPGIIGTLQANECIKIITGIGKPLCNTILSYNSLTNQFYDIVVTPNKNSKFKIPASPTDFLNFNYNRFCGAENIQDEISITEFNDKYRDGHVKIIDVREKGELPFVSEFSYQQIPLSEFEKWDYNFSEEDTVILFCQSGKRSIKALQMLKEKYPGIKARSLQGGIEAWKKQSLKKEEQL